MSIIVFSWRAISWGGLWMTAVIVVLCVLSASLCAVASRGARLDLWPVNSAAFLSAQVLFSTAACRCVFRWSLAALAVASWSKEMRRGFKLWQSALSTKLALWQFRNAKALLRRFPEA